MRSPSPATDRYSIATLRNAYGTISILILLLVAALVTTIFVLRTELNTCRQACYETTSALDCYPVTWSCKVPLPGDLPKNDPTPTLRVPGEPPTPSADNPLWSIPDGVWATPMPIEPKRSRQGYSSGGEFFKNHRYHLDIEQT